MYAMDVTLDVTLNFWNTLKWRPNDDKCSFYNHDIATLVLSSVSKVIEEALNLLHSLTVIAILKISVPKSD